MPYSKYRCRIYQPYCLLNAVPYIAEQYSSCGNFPLHLWHILLSNLNKESGFPEFFDVISSISFGNSSVLNTIFSP